MSFFQKEKKFNKKEYKITTKCLNLILESSKSVFPNEFGGMLRVDENDKETIIEVVLAPGTIQGESHTIFKLHNLPIDFNIVGTIHSHPSPNPNPSNADLQLFRKHGRIHIIAAMPFDKDSWKAFDQSGEEIELKVI